jgi:hypothetical protein
MALQTCLMAARAEGIVAVDGVYNAFKDEDGLRAECEQGRDLGFDGKTLIHPAQIDIANAVFAPEAEEIDLARRQIAAFRDGDGAGSGVAVVDGKIVENLHVATAERLLARARQSKELGGGTDMGYPILILGVALWSLAHLFKRIAPERRAADGRVRQGAGRDRAGRVDRADDLRLPLGRSVWLWSPPAFLRHVNNLLVFLGFYLFAASGLQTAITRRIRHPQLSGFKAWAVAHLLVVPPARDHPFRRVAGLGGGVGHPDQPRAARLDAPRPLDPGEGGRRGRDRGCRHRRRRLDSRLARRLAVRVTR